MSCCSSLRDRPPTPHLTVPHSSPPPRPPSFTAHAPVSVSIDTFQSWSPVAPIVSTYEPPYTSQSVLAALHPPDSQDAPTPPTPALIAKDNGHVQAGPIVLSSHATHSVLPVTNPRRRTTSCLRRIAFVNHVPGARRPDQLQLSRTNQYQSVPISTKLLFIHCSPFLVTCSLVKCPMGLLA